MTPEPPELPPALVKPGPVIAVITAAWALAAVLAFTVPALEALRPYTVAGLGVGGFGVFLYQWQLRAARRGSRGAQRGLH